MYACTCLSTGKAALGSVGKALVDITIVVSQIGKLAYWHNLVSLITPIIIILFHLHFLPPSSPTPWIGRLVLSVSL